MLYTIETPPDFIKVLPAEAIKIWVESYNSTIETKDDELSIQMAWDKVKEEYKEVDGTWIKEVIILDVCRQAE